ncbi:hypothetical protein [Paenibacillus tepidiphilus]|uniref:hypothetical protein n=1 Tax=Paenibacillus tepidiphilus TaxID=2608683 RepID=UPI00123A5B11|nr:hypothetical protein [Paenibacillus tepidiphilus]
MESRQISGFLYFDTKNRKPVSARLIRSNREHFPDKPPFYSSKAHLTALRSGHYNQNQENSLEQKQQSPLYFALFVQAHTMELFRQSMGVMDGLVQVMME